MNRNKKIIFTIFLCLVNFALQGCLRTDPRLTPTDLPSVLTSTLTPKTPETNLDNFSTLQAEAYPSTNSANQSTFFFDLEEVSCQLQLELAQKDSHWSDGFKPGSSTANDLLNVYEINANKFQNVEPQNIGLWTYESDDVILNFEDGLLYARSDPRTRLNDILLFYGTPHSIIWQVPVQNFHGAIYATYLTYPEHNAVFFTWEKVVNFTADTEFSDSNISTQENFEAILSNFVTDDFNHYEHSPWLCDS